MNTDMSRRQFVGLAGSLATVLGLGLVGCGGGAGKGSAAGSAAAKDVKGAAESKKLVVGFDKSYPPYGFVGDDGEYTGFDLDLAKAVADKQGWEVKYEAIDWDAKDTLLNSGAINCIWNGFTMEGREDDYTFSEPYMLNEQVLVVKKDAGIKSWDDLAGKTVITQTDSAAQDVLEVTRRIWRRRLPRSTRSASTTRPLCSSRAARSMPWLATFRLPSISLPPSPMLIRSLMSRCPASTTPSALRRATPSRPTP